MTTFRNLSVFLLLLPSLAIAAPSGQVDVDINTSTCVLSGVAIAPAPTTVTATAMKCVWDLAALVPGNYTAAVVAKNSLGQGGPSASFPFTMPAIPAAPSNWQLLP